MLSDRYTCVRVDLPGFGKSSTPVEVFDLEKFAQTVNVFLKKIGIDDVYAMIGHSNGGAIAIKITSMDFIHPKRLILLASSGVRQPYSHRNKILRIAAKLLKIPVRVFPRNLQKKIKIKAYQAIGSEIFIAENMQETFKKVVTEDLRIQAQNIHQKTLLIYGSNDTATPPSYGREFANSIRYSKLEIIDGSGHFVHHDANDTVNTMVKNFLL